MWAWVTIWLLVAILGAAWLFLLAREVFRKARSLMGEVDAASERAADAASATTAGSRA